MKVALFGLGSLGSAIYDHLNQFHDIDTFGSSDLCKYNVSYESPFTHPLDTLDICGQYDALIFSGGLNSSDSIFDLKPEIMARIFNSNVVFPATCTSFFVKNRLLSSSARICLVSSVWQLSSKQNKFSYTVSKSALSGFIHSAAIDLGPYPALINAVLPGVVDTPMSRKMLSDSQISNVISQTPLRRLATSQDIANVISWLVSEENTFVTGQCLTVDGGFINSKNLP